MKKALMVLAAMVLFTGCTSSTRYGDCVGVLDERVDSLTYSIDAGNVIVAIIFSETIIVPVYVLLDQIECPVGVRS